ncbi:hypothetical protein SAMN04487911_109113 [Arenibacter nanhaiticus]|uniref:VWFA domain-containing protein n=1 Tax=Arenibacter nanhaiticus TaxID=558155 RepID=A0A1M6FWS0_9FLAO|nr:VWA domain-containing protein [Arenibacter nanhaiticus]SHJ02165.1 hypothetical protein SAMN04487911_109113 [Arenibacter nanhaiticus]
MQIETVFYILLSALAALAITLFQYFYNTKKGGRLYGLLSFFRFIAVFGLLLLLVNPKFYSNNYSLEKANLIVLVDNSASIVQGDSVKAVEVINTVKNSIKALEDKFKVKTYSFGAYLKDSVPLLFREKNTNITKALASLNEIYANTNTAVVLLSDGNQTVGEDYEFYGKRQGFPIYPLVLGDSTTYEDVRIGQLNANKYAFIKNKFPLEIHLSYDGLGTVSSQLQVFSNGKQIYKEGVALSRVSNSKIISVNIDADKVGLQQIKVVASSFPNEKNTENNQMALTVEVLDEKINVAIISDILHPDIGVLKKAIASNEQRSVRLFSSSAALSSLEDMELFVLYQPTSAFENVYRFAKQKQANIFTVLGAHSDLGFMNRVQNNYLFETGYPVQDIFAVSDPSFSKFDISDFNIEGFPPLESNVGAFSPMGTQDILLEMYIKGERQDSPLLSVTEDNNSIHMLLSGENIWKWRLQSFKRDSNFKNFDDFIGKLILYLSSSKNKSRLMLEYESMYESGNKAKIKASFFDETYSFVSNAALQLKVFQKSSSTKQEMPMLLQGRHYEADLSDVVPGSYSFTVSEKNEGISRSGSFTIMDFDLEKQFLSSNYEKLQRLANNSKGELFFPEDITDLIEILRTDQSYSPIQKSKQIVVSLIDVKIILLVIVLALVIEWILRKYNGLT